MSVIKIPLRPSPHSYKPEQDCMRPIQESLPAMQNAINLLMLVCAAVGSMAFGVLAAYALCRLGFLAMHRHAAHTSAARTLHSHPAATN